MKRLFQALWAMALLAPAAAYAQGLSILTEDGGCSYTTGKLLARCFPILIGHLVQVIFSLIGVFFLLNVIYAGYEILLGGGDLGKGKERIRSSIIGFVAAACAFLIIDLVITLAGA